jgi:transposase InsO family protein
VEPIQRRVTNPREDRKVDFTHMVPCKGYKLLLILTDTFTGWVEVSHTRIERAMEVIKILLREVILRFGLPQSDKGPTFISHVTEEVTRPLDINYHLHSVWRPQASGKVKRTNQTLKRMLTKVCQETCETWVTLLPISLLRMRKTSSPKFHLSSYEILNGRPFLYNDSLI